MLTGHPLEELEENVELADLYLLLSSDVPWIDDGTRYFGDDSRIRFYLSCRDLLKKRRARFVEITGTWAEREELALAEIKKLAKEPFVGRLSVA
jgi:nicotinamide riboside kinase